MLPLRARVDLGAMAMKEYSTFPQISSTAGTSPSDCLVSYPGNSLEGLTTLQRCSRCILQPQPTGQLKDLMSLKKHYLNYIYLTDRWNPKSGWVILTCRGEGCWLYAQEFIEEYTLSNEAWKIACLHFILCKCPWERYHSTFSPSTNG